MDIASIIVAALSAAATITAVIINTKASNKEITHKLETHQAVFDTKLDALANEVREHNNFARRMLEGKQYEYPVYIDLEETDPKNKAGATDAVIGFCETMEAAGYYCGIYASDISGFKDRLELSRLTAFDKWVANYISQPGYVDTYGMWQRSSQGRVNGITGNVDIDEAYQDYPAIIKANGLNGFPKPEPQKPQKKSIKITVEYDDHIFSGLLEER